MPLYFEIELGRSRSVFSNSFGGRGRERGKGRRWAFWVHSTCRKCTRVCLISYEEKKGAREGRRRPPSFSHPRCYRALFGKILIRKHHRHSPKAGNVRFRDISAACAEFLRISRGTRTSARSCFFFSMRAARCILIGSLWPPPPPAFFFFKRKNLITRLTRAEKRIKAN